MTKKAANARLIIINLVIKATAHELARGPFIAAFRKSIITKNTSPIPNNTIPSVRSVLERSPPLAGTLSSLPEAAK